MRPWGQTSLGPQRLTKPSLGKPREEAEWARGLTQVEDQRLRPPREQSEARVRGSPRPPLRAADSAREGTPVSRGPGRTFPRMPTPPSDPPQQRTRRSARRAAVPRRRKGTRRPQTETRGLCLRFPRARWERTPPERRVLTPALSLFTDSPGEPLVGFARPRIESFASSRAASDSAYPRTTRRNARGLWCTDLLGGEVGMESDAAKPEPPHDLLPKTVGVSSPTSAGCFPLSIPAAER